MKKQHASLEYIENDRKISRETDSDFLHLMQTGLLIALKEYGKLNEIQYHHAQTRLDQQRFDWIKKIRSEGERP